MAKVLISIPDKLLEEIDKRANAEYENRSRYIREVILEKISPLKSKSVTGNVIESTAGIWGKSFPFGRTYVRKVRRGWSKRVKNY